MQKVKISNYEEMFFCSFFLPNGQITKYFGPEKISNVFDGRLELTVIDITGQRSYSEFLINQKTKTAKKIY